jgi:hypothetical protein
MQRVTLAIFVGFVALSASCTPATAQVSQERVAAIFAEEQRVLADCDARFKTYAIKTFAEHTACRGNAVLEVAKTLDLPQKGLLARLFLEYLATSRLLDAKRLTYEQADARNDASLARYHAEEARMIAETRESLRQIESVLESNRRTQAILAEAAAEQQRLELLGILSRLATPIAPDLPAATHTVCQWVGNQFQ